MKISIKNLLILLMAVVVTFITMFLVLLNKQTEIYASVHRVDSLAIELSQEANRLNVIVADYNLSGSPQAMKLWQKAIVSIEERYQALLSVTGTGNTALPPTRFDLDFSRVKQQFAMLQKATTATDRKWITINLTTYTQNLVTHLMTISEQSRAMSGQKLDILNRYYNILMFSALGLILALLAFLYAALILPLNFIRREIRTIGGGIEKVEIRKSKIVEWHDLSCELERMHDRLHHTMVSKRKLLNEVAMRKDAEYEAVQLAQRDYLTGLPNRRFFFQMLEQSINTTSGTFYLLYFDLDSFKGVNDNMGHTTGDQILMKVGELLATHILPEDNIARIGGDEFAIIHFGGNLDTVQELAQKTQALICEPVDIDDTQLRVGCSVGIARYPVDGTSAKQLLACADTAMYYAKKNPALTSRVAVYDPVLGDMSKDQFTLTHSVKKAIAEEQFDVWFQPQVEIGSGKIHGFEALLRWKKPDGTMVGPDMFIPLLEESGDIVAVGKMVISRAIDLYHQLSLRGFNYSVSINVSAIQLERPDFIDYLCDNIPGQNYDSKAFPIELTETAIFRNEAQIIANLIRLKEEGFQIQLDDFGTGNASLNILKKLPFDVIKIDKSFTQKAIEEGKDKSIVEAIVAMSEGLNFDIVIEGVETERHHQIAQNYHIAFGQGYYYARPMPQDQLISWLADYQPEELATSFSIVSSAPRRR